MNIFKKILKYLPDPKIEVVAREEKDKDIAKQMTQLLRYKIK